MIALDSLTFGSEPPTASKDSEDFSAEEAANSVETHNMQDWIGRLAEIGVAMATADLRVLDGNFYARVGFADGSVRIFQVNWVKP